MPLHLLWILLINLVLLSSINFLRQLQHYNKMCHLISTERNVFLIVICFAQVDPFFRQMNVSYDILVLQFPELSWHFWCFDFKVKFHEFFTIFTVFDVMILQLSSLGHVTKWFELIGSVTGGARFSFANWIWLADLKYNSVYLNWFWFLWILPILKFEETFWSFLTRYWQWN